MECNRDEAKKAMDIAEKKITEKDYKGAEKFAKKAETMFPDLHGLKHLWPIIKVYLSADKNIWGETDFYGILGVDPLASDVELKKQYKNLALLLHPDKNKFKGAQGAFNLLSEAWSLLSDSDKRKLYNEQMGIKGTQRTAPTTQCDNPPQQPIPTNRSEPQQPTPTNRPEPVTEESRPKPRGRKRKPNVGSPPSGSSEQQEYFVKRRLYKRSDRRVRTTP